MGMVKGDSWAIVFMCVMVMESVFVKGRLTSDFYSATCPNVESVVYDVVKTAVQRDPRMAASLLRLHFHDCFVNGCDASILLDDTPSFEGEKTSPPNLNSARGYDVIDDVKSALEFECPHTVSCADILTLAARDGVRLSGGPYWQALLGRQDSMSANKSQVLQSLPSPTASLSTLVRRFEAVGLSLEDMVTLSGSHTLGKAHCATFRERLFNHNSNPNHPYSIDGDTFLTSLQTLCGANNDNNTLALLDMRTPTKFDNQYFKNLRDGAGVLSSDQVLFSTHGITKDLVEYYAKYEEAFFENFKISMVKMGNITTPTQEGYIRRSCRYTN